MVNASLKERERECFFSSPFLCSRITPSFLNCRSETIYICIKSKIKIKIQNELLPNIKFHFIA